MTSKPICEYRTQRRIEFADTDLAGLVHFSRFFIFMETAEHEFLRSLGSEVHRQWQGHEIGWPRVEASCRYVAAARFADVLDIIVRVARKGTKSMTYDVRFERDGQLIASGRIASVCCVLHGPGGPRSIEIPTDIGDQLVEYRRDDAATD